MTSSIRQTTRVAALQMVSGVDMESNLRVAERLLIQAQAGGARMAVLPENFALFQAEGQRALAQAEASGAGPVHSFLKDMAQRLRLFIVAGSVPAIDRLNGSLLDCRVRAACRVYSDQGDVVARYDKIHLFDVDVGDAQGSYRESASIEPGDTVVMADTAIARIGLTVCYDLRFGELFQRLRDAGADVICVPAAFTYRTGQAHWETLLRARAIEQQVYIIAPNQGGEHSPTRRTWGHTMIVDPWGDVLAQLPEGEGVVLADIRPERLAELRRAMPIAQHRRDLSKHY